MNEREIKEVVRQNYLKILGREPDKEGLEFYYLQIIEEKIKPEELKKIFENSKEGKAKSQEKDLSDKMDSIMAKIIEENSPYELKIQQEKIKSIFVSCLNPKTGFGGIWRNLLFRG